MNKKYEFNFEELNTIYEGLQTLIKRDKKILLNSDLDFEKRAIKADVEDSERLINKVNEMIQNQITK